MNNTSKYNPVITHQQVVISFDLLSELLWMSQEHMAKLDRQIPGNLL
jgi:hypothetical protein